MGFIRAIVVNLAVFLAAAATLVARPPELLSRLSKGSKPVSQLNYQKDIVPLLSEYCYGCHGNGKKKGGVALDGYKDREEQLDWWPDFVRSALGKESAAGELGELKILTE